MGRCVQRRTPTPATEPTLGVRSAHPPCVRRAPMKILLGPPTMPVRTTMPALGLTGAETSMPSAWLSWMPPALRAVATVIPVVLDGHDLAVRAVLGHDRRGAPRRMRGSALARIPGSRRSSMIACIGRARRGVTSGAQGDGDAHRRLRQGPEHRDVRVRDAAFTEVKAGAQAASRLERDFSARADLQTATTRDETERARAGRHLVEEARDRPALVQHPAASLRIEAPTAAYPKPGYRGPT